MRTIHTCLRYPPSVGGVETYVYELVNRTRNLADKLDVRVLTSKMRTHGPITALAPELLLDDPPYVQRLLHQSTPLVSYPRLQSLDYYLGHHQPDLVHGYSFWYQPADTAARWANKHHRPFIFHPMYYESSVRHKFHWQIYKNTIGRRTFSLADAVVVISPYEQRLIEQAGFPVKRFILIPPGISLAEFQPSFHNPLSPYSTGGPNILCVSRLSADKKIQDVIAILPSIITHHPQTKLFIIGDDFGHLTQLQDQVSRLGLTNRVEFLGQVNRQQLLAAYEHADLFIHPSNYEAFGIVIAEAMAARTPVIARRTSAVPYIAPHEQCALLFNNQDELLAHTLTILSNDTLSQRLVEQAVTRLSHEFTWEQSIKKLTDLYKDIVPRNQSM